MGLACIGLLRLYGVCVCVCVHKPGIYMCVCVCVHINYALNIQHSGWLHIQNMYVKSIITITDIPPCTQDLQHS